MVAKKKKEKKRKTKGKETADAQAKRMKIYRATIIAPKREWL